MSGRQVGTLNTLGVAPERQGQGIGLALAAGAMGHLRERVLSLSYPVDRSHRVVWQAGCHIVGTISDGQQDPLTRGLLLTGNLHLSEHQHFTEVERGQNMGIMDMIQSMAGQGNAATTPNAQVTGGLVEELQNRPGGLGGLLQSFHQNGMGDQPTMIKMGLGVAVPVLIHHLVSNGHVDQQINGTGSEPEMGGMLQSVLGRIL